MCLYRYVCLSVCLFVSSDPSIVNIGLHLKVLTVFLFVCVFKIPQKIRISSLYLYLSLYPLVDHICPYIHKTVRMCMANVECM